MFAPEISQQLGPALEGALTKKGFASLTRVQEAVLAPELAGRDLRISSITGSGKTVALGLVVREHVRGGTAPPQALVVTPTRELAKQVEEELAWLFASVPAKVASVTGGSSYRDERRALHANPAIIVGTPGRLLDHLQRSSIDPSALKAVVLDEADRMLDLGFRDDIEAILGFAPKDHRTHLVSATFSREVRALADRVQRDALQVEGTPLGSANQDIDHVIHLVAVHERVNAIVNLLLATPGAQTLIFARTRADVADLSDTLRDAGFVVGMLSGEMEQPERNRALTSFKRGYLDALVATDVAARGIDVHDIGRVIHAEPPNDADAYTHRSGRTGRAGKKGTSSVLVAPTALGKTQRLLERAKVAWHFEAIPTPDQIRALRDDRVIELLTSDPDETDLGASEEPDDHLNGLAERIAASEKVTRAIARLLMRARAGGPAKPREVSIIPPPTKRGRESEVRGGRIRDERNVGREENGDWERFRISWGQAHGADARRLLAMVCRRGDIKSRDIGAIRIARTYSVIEVSAAAAEGFESATREPDPRDPRVTIRRELEDGPPRRGAPPREAPRREPPPREAPRREPPRSEASPEDAPTPKRSEPRAEVAKTPRAKESTPEAPKAPRAEASKPDAAKAPRAKESTRAERASPEMLDRAALLARIEDSAWDEDRSTEHASAPWADRKVMGLPEGTHKEAPPPLIKDRPSNKSWSSPDGGPPREDERRYEKKPFGKGAGGYEKKPYDKGAPFAGKKPYDKGAGGYEKKPYDKGAPYAGKKPYEKSAGGYEKKPYDKGPAGSDDRRPPYAKRSDDPPRRDGGGDSRRPPRGKPWKPEGPRPPSRAPFKKSKPSR